MGIYFCFLEMEEGPCNVSGPVTPSSTPRLSDSSYSTTEDWEE